MHSIIHSGLIGGRDDTEEGRQTVFSTALDPMSNAQEEEHQDAPQPRKVHYKSKWKVIQDAIKWISSEKGSRKRVFFMGKLDLMPLSFTTLCQPTALKEWKKPN